jgi:hypothetical protein
VDGEIVRFRDGWLEEWMDEKMNDSIEGRSGRWRGINRFWVYHL